MSRSSLLGAVLGLLVAAPPARAEPAIEPLRFDPVGDVALAGLGTGVALLLTSLQGQLAAPTCRWCSEGPLDGPVQSALRWRDTHAADVASSVLGEGALPVACLAFAVLSGASQGELKGGLADAVMIVQATSFALVLSEGLKYAVGRARPWAEAPGSAASADANLSFPSGHTTFAFAVVASTATVAALRGRKGTLALVLTGAAAAALVGYLRIAADQHHLTDVLAGAGLGTAVGILVPLLLHRQLEDPARAGTIRPSAGGIAVAF